MNAFGVCEYYSYHYMYIRVHCTAAPHRGSVGLYCCVCALRGVTSSLPHCRCVRETVTFIHARLFMHVKVSLTMLK